MVGGRPLESDELDFCKRYLIRGYPGDFETPSDVARQLETLVEYDLPDDYFNKVLPQVEEVTAEDVLEQARKYLLLDHLTIVVVGDREQIEAGLRELPVGSELTVMQFDDSFRLKAVE